MESIFDGWDNPDSAEDFFADDINSETEDIVKEALKEESDEDLKESPTKEEKEEEGELDLFGEAPAFSTEDDEEDDEVSPQEPSGSNLELYNTLKERGLVNLEPEDGVELTEELAEELIEDGLEGFIDNKIREKLNSLPRDVQGLIRYSLSGGDMKSYIDSIGNLVTSIPDNVDFNSEEDQEIVVRNILAEEGNDEDTIESQIEFLKDSGKLRGFAENKYKLWSTKKSQEEEKIIKKREEDIRQAKIRMRERKQEYTNLLSESDNIKGITVPRKIKKEIPNYIEDRNIALENGSYITELQRDLFYELPKNKEALIQLAVLMKNRNEDGTFNFKDIANSIQTEVVKKIKKDVRRSKPVLPSSSDRTVKMNRPLADYF